MPLVICIVEQESVHLPVMGMSALVMKHSLHTVPNLVVGASVVRAYGFLQLAPPLLVRQSISLCEAPGISTD